MGRLLVPRPPGSWLRLAAQPAVIDCWSRSRLAAAARGRGRRVRGPCGRSGWSRSAGRGCWLSWPVLARQRRQPARGPGTCRGRRGNPRSAVACRAAHKPGWLRSTFGGAMRSISNSDSADRGQHPAAALARLLCPAGVSPVIGTPCGVLAPLYEILAADRLRTVNREDVALGIAAGAVCAGGRPVVLMQNSGFGQSVNAMSSLIVPYGAPILLVLGMRGLGSDKTPENQGMGILTGPILNLLGVPTITFDSGADLDRVRDFLMGWRKSSAGPAAVLVSVEAFNWTA